MQTSATSRYVDNAPRPSVQYSTREMASEETADESREQSGENVQEHLYKVLVIGDFGVGTQNISRKFVCQCCMKQLQLCLLIEYSQIVFSLSS